jgi:L-threonylcarbamoyladenylate synthase
MTDLLQINQATRVLLTGGVIAYPTEGVYGLGCLPDDHSAVQRIFQIKQRSAYAGLILVAPEYDLLADWINPDEIELQNLLRPTASPVTWIVNAGAHVPGWLSGQRSTLAVRITQHPVIAKLCYSSGSALVSTSANHSGHRAAQSALQTRKWLGKQLDYVVSGKLGGACGPSEIRRGSFGKLFRTFLTTKTAFFF